jgi:hypothetical protein
MNERRHLKGSLLIELLVVCALIALFLPLVVTALVRMQERHLLAQTYQDQQTIKAAIDAHFQAQWARLVPASCLVSDDLFLTIESGMSPPLRLATRIVDKESDWLRGVDYGLCRGSVSVADNPFETRLSCHWKVGDNVRFSSCESYHQGQVLSVSAQKSSIQLAGDTFTEGNFAEGKVTESAIGQSGIIESQDGFYWYVSEGKEGRNAFWRTPLESGNSLELWNGVERLSVFPLLDDDQDGMVDALDTRYGHFALSHLRGLWVEYQYRLNDCKSERNTQLEQEYLSMRGDVWRYSSPCQGVGNQIIVLKGI